jgi:hypothetical protein
MSNAGTNEWLGKLLRTRNALWMMIGLSLMLSLALACDLPSEQGEGEQSTDADTKVEEYVGCKGLEDLIPKLALPTDSKLSYYEVVAIGLDEHCDTVIKAVNKPELFKD